MMNIFNFHVLLLLSGLVGALKISSVDSNKRKHDDDKLPQGFNIDLEAKYILPSHPSIDLEVQDVGNDPRNWICQYLPEDVSENLKDWEYLFTIGSGKKILLEGDSLMTQLYKSIACASKVLGMHATVDGDKTLVKRSENDIALEIHFRHFQQFSGIRESPHTRAKVIIPVEELCNGASEYDYVFANLGHHEIHPATPIQGSRGLPFEKKVQSIFERTKACGLANNSHFSWIGHPPSHFKYSLHGNGGFVEGQENVASECSCNLPRLEEQPNIRNSRFAKHVAGNYGLQYISVWEDFKDKCDKHPFDCQHYLLSPIVFAPIAGKISAVMNATM